MHVQPRNVVSRLKMRLGIITSHVASGREEGLVGFLYDYWAYSHSIQLSHVRETNN